MVGPYALLLFGGNIEVNHQEGLVTVDGWATFASPAKTAVLLRELRAGILHMHMYIAEFDRAECVVTCENRKPYNRYLVVADCRSNYSIADTMNERTRSQ